MTTTSIRNQPFARIFAAGSEPWAVAREAVNGGASKMVSTIAAKNHAPVFRGGTSHALCRPSACISTIRSVRDARAISSATGFSSPWAARNLPGGGLAILVARLPGACGRRRLRNGGISRAEGRSCGVVTLKLGPMSPQLDPERPSTVTIRKRSWPTCRRRHLPGTE